MRRANLIRQFLFLSVGGVVFLFLPFPSSAQVPQGVPSSQGQTQEEPLFAIDGHVLTGNFVKIPDMIEVTLERAGALVDQTYIRSDRTFQFSGLHQDTYHILIKADKFEEINQVIPVSGQVSQTFFVNIFLVPKTELSAQTRAVEADDDMGDTISVAMLSAKIPHKAVKWYKKSLELDHKKKLADAQAALEHAVTLAPDFYSAQRNLGILFIRQNQPEKAVIPLQAALKLNPSSGKVSFYLALAYLQTGHLDVALKQFSQAITLSPEKASPYYFQGYIYYKENRLKDAEESLRKAFERDPYVKSFSRLQLANVYMKEANLTEAFHEMELFLKEQPTAQEVSQVMANLRILKQMLGSDVPH